jgi:PII-like signaling protein
VSTPARGTPEDGAPPPGGAVPQLAGPASAEEDCLKLTTYFGERDRTPRGLLSDELLDIYGRHSLRTSILLRGAEGFGRLHHLRTDRLLSLSEDLPVVSVAVDGRERIEALLEPVLKIKRRGLITLERARMLGGAVGPVQLPERLGEATKLTVYVGRRERAQRMSAFVAVTDLLSRSGISGASVLLGVDGTRHGHRLRARFFARNADVPVMIIAVGPGERIAGVLPALGGLLREPLMTLERVRICKRDGELLARPHELPATDERGLTLWQKLMIYTSNAATHEGHPLHHAIVRRLRESDAAGATVLRGIWGFHGEHAPHGDKLLQLARHVPVCTVVVDTPARIARSFQIIDELTAEHGLVTSEMVPAMSAMSERERRGGLRLANHDF